MRIKGKQVDIDYSKTKKFFDSREEKYREDYPYVATMYQDAHPELTDERNKAEVSKILPLLQLDKNARVLDLGCGVGRWADAIEDEITEYLGIDFSEGLIQIAQKRNKKRGFSFKQVSVCDFGNYFRLHNLERFNRLIIAGVLMYLNDSDIKAIFQLFSDILAPEALVYLREPIGIQERLTLKDFYSEELAHDYNTIYRTAEEYSRMLAENVSNFAVVQAGHLFDQPSLNNRKETSQYYYILKKEPLE